MFPEVVQWYRPSHDFKTVRAIQKEGYLNQIKGTPESNQ
jgi:hypothetical protein